MGFVWKSPSVTALWQKVGESTPQAAVVKLANELVASTGMTKPPFDHTILAGKRNVTRIREARIKLAAYLVPLENGSYEIVLNSADSRQRQRFSCNHEVGHTFFIEHSPRLRARQSQSIGTSNSEDPEEERLCDVAATELLLPWRHFTDCLSERVLSVTTIIDLAFLFDASIRSTAIRFCEATSKRVLIAAWKAADTRDPEKGLRLLWVAKSAKAMATVSALEVFGPDSQVYRTFATGETLKGRDVFSLGGRPEPYYIETARPREESSSVVSLTILEPSAENLARSFRFGKASAQRSLFE